MVKSCGHCAMNLHILCMMSVCVQGIDFFSFLDFLLFFVSIIYDHIFFTSFVCYNFKKIKTNKKNEFKQENKKIKRNLSELMSRQRIS